MTITMWAVLVGGFELQCDIAGAVVLESFIGDGGAGDERHRCCVLGAPSRQYPVIDVNGGRSLR